MRTIEVLLFFIFTAFFSSINGQIAVVTNLRSGSPNSDKMCQELFESINSKYIPIVVFLGDITASGKEEEFLSFGSLLENQLEPDDYIIPGLRDIQNNPAGYSFVRDQFDGTKVRLDSSALLLAGLSNYSAGSSMINFYRTDLDWLDSLVNKVLENRIVFFFSPAPLSKTENWYQVFNILSKQNSKFLFTAGDENKISGFKGIDEIIFKPSLTQGTWNYNIISADEDSIYLYNQRDTVLTQWGKVALNGKEITTPVDTSLINNFSSEINWSIKTGKNLIAPPLVNENRIYAASLNGQVDCFDLNGKTIWSHNIERTITTHPVRDRDLIIIGTAEGDLVSINSNNGDIVQVIGTGEPLITDPVLINVENLNGKYKGVVIGTSSGRMLCYDIYSFEVLWDINEVKGKLNYITALDGKLFCTGSGTLYCIDWNNGTLIWKWSAGRNINIVTPPETDSANIYLSASNKSIYAVDLLLGSTVWRKNDMGSVPTLKLSEDKKELFIKSFRDEFIILEPLTGNIVKRIKCGFPADTERSYINTGSQGIMFSSSDGKIRLIEDQSKCVDAFFLGGGFLNSFEPVGNGSYLISNDQGTIINVNIISPGSPE